MKNIHPVLLILKSLMVPFQRLTQISPKFILGGTVATLCLIASLLGQSISPGNSLNRLITEEEYDNFTNGQYIYGFSNIHFFMTPEEVREKITEIGLAEGSTIEELDSDIYAYPKTVTQDFVYYNPSTRKHYPFSVVQQDMNEFLNTIVDKKLDTRVYHLSKRYYQDFKILTIPASIENNRPWEVRLVFFNRHLNEESVYRLFAISLSYRGGNTEDTDFYPVSAQTITRVREQLYRKYGSSHEKKSIYLDEARGVQKFYETFLRFYRSEQYQYNQVAVKNYSIPVQLSTTHTSLYGQYRNFQISYVAADYIDELFNLFTTSQYRYEDIDIDDDINIDF